MTYPTGLLNKQTLFFICDTYDTVHNKTSNSFYFISIFESCLSVVFIFQEKIPDNAQL